MWSEWNFFHYFMLRPMCQWFNLDTNQWFNLNNKKLMMYKVFHYFVVREFDKISFAKRTRRINLCNELDYYISFMFNDLTEKLEGTKPWNVCVSFEFWHKPITWRDFFMVNVKAHYAYHFKIKHKRWKLSMKNYTN